MSLKPIIPPNLVKVNGTLKPLAEYPQFVRIGNIALVEDQGIVPPAGSTYLRPGGVNTYFRPDGTSTYQRP